MSRRSSARIFSMKRVRRFARRVNPVARLIAKLTNATFGWSAAKAFAAETTLTTSGTSKAHLSPQPGESDLLPCHDRQDGLTSLVRLRNEGVRSLAPPLALPRGMERTELQHTQNSSSRPCA